MTNYIKIFFLGISYEELKNELLNGFRLTNPRYSPPEISHMVQTCWLPDPKERPTFTTLKQLTWESSLACDRENDKNMNVWQSSLNSNDKMHRRYKRIRKCNAVYQRQKQLGTKDESGSTSIATQSYADLDLSRLKALSKIDLVSKVCMVEGYRNEEETVPLTEVPDQYSNFDEFRPNGKIRLVFISSVPIHYSNALLIDTKYLNLFF